MLNKHDQTAGNNSSQVQAETVIINNVGIDEKRAREICKEINLQLRNEYTQEALSIATARVAEFENLLLPKMEAVNGALDAFADPSFQLLLLEAQKTAAATERPADYDLLAELLIHRFLKGENRMTRAGINRAVEIVDEISDDALLGMTVFHSASYLFPVTGDINEGLIVLNDLFGKLLYDTLPTGQEWLDHLDILDAVRINTFGGLKSLEVYYSEMLTGYIDVGIKKGSEEYNEAIKILQTSGIPMDIFCEHTLNKDFMRLMLTSVRQIELIKFQRVIRNSFGSHLIDIELTDEQKEALRKIYGLYSQDEEVKREILQKFLEEWNKFENLKILRDWWNNLGITIKLTSVGTVLAHSNAQRCDKNLPPLS